MSIEFDVLPYVYTCAAQSVRLLAEFEASRAADGSGTHRAPDTVFRELSTAVVKTRNAARAACDEAAFP